MEFAAWWGAKGSLVTKFPKDLKIDVLDFMIATVKEHEGRLDKQIYELRVINDKLETIARYMAILLIRLNVEPQKESENEVL